MNCKEFRASNLISQASGSFSHPGLRNAAILSLAIAILGFSLRISLSPLSAPASPASLRPSMPCSAFRATRASGCRGRTRGRQVRPGGEAAVPCPESVPDGQRGLLGPRLSQQLPGEDSELRPGVSPSSRHAAALSGFISGKRREPVRAGHRPRLRCLHLGKSVIKFTCPIRGAGRDGTGRDGGAAPRVHPPPPAHGGRRRGSGSASRPGTVPGPGPQRGAPQPRPAGRAPGRVLASLGAALRGSPRDSADGPRASNRVELR